MQKILSDQETHHTRFFSPNYPHVVLGPLLAATNVRPSTLNLYDLTNNTGFLNHATLSRNANFTGFGLDTGAVEVASTLGNPPFGVGESIFCIAGQIHATGLKLQHKMGLTVGLASSMNIELRSTAGGLVQIFDDASTPISTGTFAGYATGTPLIVAAKCHIGTDAVLDPTTLEAVVMDKDGVVLETKTGSGFTGDSYSQAATNRILRGAVIGVCFNANFPTGKAPSTWKEDCAYIYNSVRIGGHLSIPASWRSRTTPFA
jgi:hypothetical protein